MKLRFIFVLYCTLAVAACGPKPVRLLEVEGVQFNTQKASLTTAPSAVRVHNENRNAGFGIYHSVADWTPYKALRWTVENHSEEPMPL